MGGTHYREPQVAAICPGVRGIPSGHAPQAFRRISLRLNATGALGAERVRERESIRAWYCKAEEWRSHIHLFGGGPIEARLVSR